MGIPVKYITEDADEQKPNLADLKSDIENIVQDAEVSAFDAYLQRIKEKTAELAGVWGIKVSDFKLTGETYDDVKDELFDCLAKGGISKKVTADLMGHYAEFIKSYRADMDRLAGKKPNTETDEDYLNVG